MKLLSETPGCVIFVSSGLFTPQNIVNAVHTQLLIIKLAIAVTLLIKCIFNN